MAWEANSMAIGPDGTLFLAISGRRTAGFTFDGAVFTIKPAFMTRATHIKWRSG
jgi:hypothetical protein